MTEAEFIPRALDLAGVAAQKSCFLLGPRQTGKSALIRSQLRPDHQFNLLESDTFLRLSQAPHILRESVRERGALVVIDEVQRLPALLNEVHWLIEERKARFVLTGSSARKLRSGGVNLLGGRARSRRLHPFSYAELGARRFDLKRALNFGLLPAIYLSDSPQEDLKAYAHDYLQNEIIAEAATRSIPAFGRFLQVAGAASGDLINYQKLALDAQVPRSTVQEYFQVLRDTLIGHELPAYTKTRKRKAATTSRFYLFDLGVARILHQGPPIEPRTVEWGRAFEALIGHELRCYLDYRLSGGADALCFWRSSTQLEVDFVVGDQLAIEVKASSRVSSADTRGLRALREERALLKRHIVVCDEPHPRRLESGIEILPWRVFLTMLWDGELVR